MNLLVSDYDQTISMDNLSTEINVIRLKKFMNNENIFMLSTGRTYDSIQEEIKKWKIPYDYLSCVDGTTLYDSNNNILYCLKLSDSDLNYSNYLKLKYGSKVRFYDINSDQSDKIEERVIEIMDIAYKKIIFEIQEYFNKYLTDSEYSIKYNRIYLRPKGINKSTAINYLEDKLKIPRSNIFTIGDHNNDLDMIRNYNGFTMLWGTRLAKEYALKKYLLMSQLIFDIEKNNDSFKNVLRYK